MKRKLLFLFLFSLIPSLLSAQGFVFPIQTAQFNSSGTVRVIPSALITVCAANDVNIPCTTKVSIFTDPALTKPLSNPFNADINGNYSFAVASGSTYTITVTGVGTAGLSYQATAGGGIPSTPNCAPTIASVLCYDSTNNRLVLGNGVNTSFLLWTTAAPTSGHCTQFSGTFGATADSGGVCGGGGGGGAWSSLSNPSGNLSLTMGANATLFTFNAATGSSDLFTWTDSNSNTGTGSLGHFTTASGSTMNPWKADSNGAGWFINSSGNLLSLSTASIAVPGTAHGLVASEGAGSPVSIICGAGLTGQLVMATNGSDPACVSTGISDGNGQAAVTSTPYTVLCDSGTTVRDRSTTIRFQSGSSVVTMPDHTATGCGKNFTLTLINDGAGTLTINRGGSDTFTVVNGVVGAQDGQTSFTLSNGGFATCNNGTGVVWECRTTPPIISYWNIAGREDATASVVANQLSLGAIGGVPSMNGINHIQVSISVADGTNNSAFCIYNASGALVAHTAPATYASTGFQSIATVETNASIPGGKVYFGRTSVGAVLVLNAISHYPISLYGNNSFGSTSGGACPGSITPPADAPADNVNFMVVGFAP